MNLLGCARTRNWVNFYWRVSNRSSNLRSIKSLSFVVIFDFIFAVDEQETEEREIEINSMKGRRCLVNGLGNL